MSELKDTGHRKLQVVKTYEADSGTERYWIHRTGRHHIVLSPAAVPGAGSWRIAETMDLDDDGLEINSGDFAAGTPVREPILSASAKYVIVDLVGVDVDVEVELG